MTANELRRKFIDFFVKRGHKELPGANLIPENDPSVLFTTAGMQQFKRFYTSPDEAPSKNVVTIQPCFRTSDIELVGDESHLTFFEMLGNFSFGGYFKKEAISWAYEFLTKDLGIDSERIWCSTFAGDDKNPRDDESSQVLQNMRIRFEEHNRDDNFWGPTGEEGPCGPTVEFYVDEMEVWNLVFNEYYRKRDGNYRKLETPGVDTGMGLERTLVILNGLKNVYETDLFVPVMVSVAKEMGLDRTIDENAVRIIADHIKASAMLVRDGVLPDKKKQGAILKRLIRESVRESGWYQDALWVEPVINIIVDIYNINQEDKDRIIQVIAEEVEKYNAIIVYAQDELSKKKAEDFNIDNAFFLYQTHAVPFEIYSEYAAMKGVKLDIRAFREKLKAHQELSRTASAGMFKGGLAEGSEQAIKYHTATHLLLAALREVLGEHVHQRGSNITSERLRFDFSHPEKLTPEQIKQVEDLVNEKIKEDLPVDMKEMSLKDAKNCGAIGEFGHKYGFKAKVYFMGPSTLRQAQGRPESNRRATSSGQAFSKEICGGPHVEHTGELGHFKIIKEESSSAGVRRIKAILE